jgi:glucose-1-phosphate adenylyltransferase
MARGDDGFDGDVLALVLAGGKGSRLGGLTRDIAKPALPFAGQYRVIDFGLSNCINSGFRRIGVLTQYQADPLIRHLQHAWNYLPTALGEFIEIWPPQQKLDDSWYRGTADAVYQNLDAIMRLRPKYVLVLAGDHVYQMDYRCMLETHRTTGADVTVACSVVPVDQATRFGVMAVDRSQRVHGFHEKPAQPRSMPDRPDRALVSMGIYLFDTEILIRELCQNASLPTTGHDFGHDVIPRMIDTRRVVAHRFCDEHDNPHFWFDIGTLDAYHDAHMALLDGCSALDLHSPQWAIRSTCTNGRPARIFDDGKFRSSVSNSLLSAGCEVAGSAVSMSAMSENVRIGAGSLVAKSVLLPDAVIGENCRIERAIIDAGCVVPPGAVINAETARQMSGCELTPNGITLVTRRATYPLAKGAGRAEPHRASVDLERSYTAAI